MSEIRRLNDARRERFCHPGAEGDEFVICDLGTPWCSIDHDEDIELALLAAPPSPAEVLKAHRAQLEKDRREIDEKASRAAKHRVVIFGVVVWSCVAIMLITMLVTALTR
jgi:hypothetical protein